MPDRRDTLVIGALALLIGTLFASAIRQPGYTDAYYYFNAGQRLTEGDGLTDPYLWIYINPPDYLPGPSHTYWMPLESLMAAISMALGGATFGVAQVPCVLCLVGLVLLAFWLGGYLGQSRRHAWMAGLLVLFSGFFTPFWTTTDTFALYGLVGALALVAVGLGRETGNWRWYVLGGVFCALAHLIRADGLLLLIVLLSVVLWPPNSRRSITAASLAIAAYLLVMLPWFIRNIAEIGTPLPLGGTQTIWLRGYDELVNYPPGVNARDFLNWGLDHILQSRWEALKSNVGTFVAVETWVILSPFILIGLWKRRKAPFLLGLILYAVGLHLVMTFVFAYPGYRGGLFHSSSALLPFWAILGLLGLDDSINWMVKKRRRWQKAQAVLIFNSALIVLVVLLSLSMLTRRAADWNNNGAFYRNLADDLPPDAVLMINDPAALYYYTKLAGVVIPNAEPDVVPDIAARYGVTHLVLDANRTQPFSGLYLGQETRPFLRLYRQMDDVRIFEIQAGENGE